MQLERVFLLHKASVLPLLLKKKLWSCHKQEPHVKLVDAICKLQSRERGKRSLCCSHELAVSLATSHLLSIIL